MASLIRQKDSSSKVLFFFFSSDSFSNGNIECFWVCFFFFPLCHPRKKKKKHTKTRSLLVIILGMWFGSLQTWWMIFFLSAWVALKHLMSSFGEWEREKKLYPSPSKKIKAFFFFFVLVCSLITFSCWNHLKDFLRSQVKFPQNKNPPTHILQVTGLPQIKV